MGDTPLQRLFGAIGPKALDFLRERVSALRPDGDVHMEQAKGAVVGASSERCHWVARSGDLLVAIAGHPLIEAPDPARTFLDEFRARGVESLQLIKVADGHKKSIPYRAVLASDFAL